MVATLIAATPGVVNAQNQEVLSPGDSSRCAVTSEAASKAPILEKTSDTAADQALIDKIHRELENKEISLRTSLQYLDFSEAVVLASVNGESRVRSITIPIREPGVYKASGITFIVDSSENILDQAESRVVLDSNGNYQVETYREAELVETVNTGVSKSQALGETPFPMTYGWGEKVGCVAATLGVTAAVAKIIVSMCGASCVAAETGVGVAICAACITGIVSIGGVSITAVYQCFKL